MPQSYPVSAIAQLLKLSERRVQQLVKDGILPRPIKGEYDAIKCVHGYLDYLKKLAAGSGELSLTDERTRLTKYQADLAEIEIKKAHGELIKTDDAMKSWGGVVMAVRQRLLGLPTRLAPVVATSQSLPEIKERIDSAINEVLDELANPDLHTRGSDENPAIDSESVEGLPAPAPADSEPVGGQKKKAVPGK